jgi:hypothetical protein
MPVLTRPKRKAASPRSTETEFIVFEEEPLVPPVRNPMFQGDDLSGTGWHLTRVWYIFFEQLARQAALRIVAAAEEPDGTGVETNIRTLVLKDTAIGDDIADHVTAYVPGTARRITGVLRRPAGSDLAIRVNKNGTEFVVITIPAGTAIDTPVEETAFADPAIADGDVFSWDVTASDGSADRAGVATFTLEWITLRVPAAAGVGEGLIAVNTHPVTVVIS